MGTNNFWRRRALLLGLMASACWHSAMAQETNFLRRLMKDHLNFEVHVTDAAGHPLAGSILWINESSDAGLKSGTPDLVASQRFSARYWRLADFLGDDLPGFVLHWTDTQGFYRKEREYTSRHSSGGYPYILVATKRGYLPQVIEGIAPLNRHHVVEIKLHPDPQAPKLDPRMVRFDEIMALARAPLPGEDFMGVPRMRRLQDLEQELRTLAQAFEREGKAEEASTTYWALADFPEVKNTMLPDGSTRIVGYANGRTGPAAEADRIRAAQLNKSVPKLLIDQLRMAHGLPRIGITNAVQGRGYLEAFYAVRSGPLGEQLTPYEYGVAIFQVIKYGSAEEACGLLKQAYHFEPFTMPLKDWWARIRDIRQPSHSCVIDGLPLN